MKAIIHKKMLYNVPDWLYERIMNALANESPTLAAIALETWISNNRKIGKEVIVWN